MWNVAVGMVIALKVCGEFNGWTAVLSVITFLQNTRTLGKGVSFLFPFENASFTSVLIPKFSSTTTIPPSTTVTKADYRNYSDHSNFPQAINELQPSTTATRLHGHPEHDRR